MRLKSDSKKNLLVMSLLLFAICTFGQVGNPVQMDAFPPAPTASSLGKFANIPVSTYTGVPSISVPIWEVKEGNINLPISLNYHARGIQVDETASWVGLGWALQAGGVITRTVRGIPDDVANGLFDPTNLIPSNYSTSLNDKFQQYADGVYDSQPDLFTFNIGGKTGTFQFDNSGNIYLVPFQKIKIEPIYANSLRLGEWKITTEDGFVYRFQVRERGRILSQCNGTVSAGSIPYYTSTWYLSSITTPAGASVLFEYAPSYYYYYPISTFENKYSIVANNGGEPMVDTKCVINNEITEGTRLTKIKFSTGEIEFVANNNRYDLPGDKSLEYILIKDHKSTVIRKFKLNYQYMYGNSLLNVPNYGYTNADAPNYRLTLNSVQEFDALGSISKPAYKFGYTLGLPNRLARAVDHWGFYNGQAGNTTLIPEEIYNGQYIGGADRNTYIEYAQMGTLNKITYPTGGSTSFTYELNEADRGLPKFRTQSVNLVSGIFNGVWDKVPQQIPFVINSVGGDGVWVKLNLSNLPCGANGEPFNGCGMYLAISKNVNGSIGTNVFHSWSIQDLGTKTIYLPNGQYFLHTGLTGYDNNTIFYHGFTFYLNWKELSGDLDYMIGGLRLAKMVDTDPILNKSIVKNYDYKLAATGRSSGRVSNLPFTYAYLYQTEKSTFFEGANGAPPTTIYGYSLYRVKTSTPNVPMALTQGGHVGYKEVTIYYGEKAVYMGVDKGVNGKTILKYTSPEEYPDLNVVEGFPFPALESRDWKRGLLLESMDYKRVGANYIPVKKIVNTYNMYDEHNSNANVSNNRGLKVGWYTRGSYLREFVYKYYDFYTGYVEKSGTTETSYNTDGTQSFSKTSNIQYGVNHLQPVKITTNGSDGTLNTSILTYPLDYTNTYGFINSLKVANIISAPIEDITYKSDASGLNARIISGKLTTYKDYPLGVKDKEYYLETASPISSASFQFSTRASSNVIPPAGAASLFYQNPLYKLRVSYDQYDDKGNLLQYTQDGYPVSVLWGYNKSLPIAQVNNASRYADNVSAVWSECLFNGFEMGASPGEYGWYDFDASKVIVDRNIEPDNVHSGRYALRINPIPSGGVNYGPTSDMLPVRPQKGKYKLSCWVKTPTGFPANNAALQMYVMKGGTCCDGYPNSPLNSGWFIITPTNNQWQYVETVIDFDQLKALAPNDDLVIRTYSLNFSSTYPIYIDDIRIHAVDAQMKTYTYDTQIGVSSVTTPDGKLELYEYDSLGRLMNIKDQDGNIVKSFTYVYGNK